MPKASKLKAKKKNLTEENDEDKEEINAEKKKKLLTEIRHLKLLVTQTECNLTPIRFSDVRLEENSQAQSTSATRRSSTELTDTNAAFQYELCSYAGLCCKKIEGDIVVAFQSRHESWSANKNWIQLVREEECWKLGQWAMPMGVDVSAIIAKYSMNSMAEMKLFLQECKHLVDCHNHREQEFKQLEEFLSHMKRYGFSVEANYGYTNVTMKLVKKNASSSSKNDRDVLVYLFYNKDRARPRKISIDCEGEDALPHDRMKELHRFFQCFKNVDLIDAAKRTLASPESPFIWKDASLDDSIIEVNGEAEDDMETSFSKLLKKKSAVSKKRGKDKSETIDENSNSHRENDLSSDAPDASDPEVNENEVSQVDSNSNKRKKRATVKKSEPIEKKSRAKKVKDVAKPKKRENTSVVKVSDKSENPRASIKKYLTTKDCNENVVSEKPKNIASEKSEKTSKTDDKVESAVPTFIESKIKQVSSAPSAGSDEKAAKKRKSAAGMENIENQPKKSKPNSVISSSTPKSRRPYDVLLCSTPITECAVVLSTIAEENISAIAKETTTNLQVRDNAEENDKASDLQQFDHSVSEESDENDATEVYNNQSALLKDLQDVKYNNNVVTDKVAKKSVKRKTKPPSRGKNKVPKH